MTSGSRTLTLNSGGALTLTISLDLLRLTPRDREFVIGLIERFEDYEEMARDVQQQGDLPKAGLTDIDLLREANKKLEAFFRAGMEVAFEGHDWDGGAMQSKAEELGLIRQEIFDPSNPQHAAIAESREEEGYVIEPGATRSIS